MYETDRVQVNLSAEGRFMHLTNSFKKKVTHAATAFDMEYSTYDHPQQGMAAIVQSQQSIKETGTL